MIRLPQDGILYHGSYTEVSHIDLSQCRNGLDFGKGFYVTSSLKQAVSYFQRPFGKRSAGGYWQTIFQNQTGGFLYINFNPIQTCSSIALMTLMKNGCILSPAIEAVSYFLN